ncbi:hypothetical protein LWI29_032181 [Acer saccharum]|uniref:C-JID domain-containing protein n=1 Tax=Acer saccharum TaxID=4024 RepID=A0AA39W3B9_ACESA|nr:hypothetical protein LWI29_032181 [Acer saccharum]
MMSSINGFQIALFVDDCAVECWKILASHVIPNRSYLKKAGKYTAGDPVNHAAVHEYLAAEILELDVVQVEDGVGSESTTSSSSRYATITGDGAVCWQKEIEIQHRKKEMLEKNGTKEVEGISLNMDHLKDVHLNLSCQVFDKMPNLILLFFTYPLMSNKVHLPNGLNSLPDDLIILEWHRYPLRALPSNFSPEKLVKLDLSFSNIEQLWEGTKGYEEPPTKFSIYLPGSEIPEWFTYQSSGSSISIQVLRQDLVDRKFMGFAICAVLRIEEYHSEHQFLGVRVNCHFETYDDYISFPLYYNIYDRDGHGVSINSDHILLGYSSFSKFDYLYQNLEKLFAGDIDYLDISFEIKERIEDYKMKLYAVHPIYVESKEIIGATIEDTGETSGRRNDRSNGNEEEVEPHPK